jgi:zinc and cadmium transporter
MNTFLYALASAIGVSLVSLVGIATIPFSDESIRGITFILVSLATGALFGDALLHILPDVFRHDPHTVQSSLWVLAGILASFIFEKFLRWKHHHEDNPGHDHHARGNIKPVGRIILVSDGLHNLVDGILIGASFQVNHSVGVATTLAVALHELPHEIGDFGVLIDSGYTKTRALLFNFLCACISIVGVLIAFGFQSSLTNFPWVALPLTGGSFLYIAGSNLTPELQKEHAPERSLIQCVAMMAGVGLMTWLLFLG